LARGLVASRRGLAVAALAILGVGIGGFAFDIWHVGRNENLKALLWRPGVVARRAYQVAAAAWDRDRDGFTPLLGGRGLDHRNPRVHPAGTEVPANGVDDNCYGGDAAPRTPVVPPPPAGRPLATGYGKSFLFVAIDTLRASRMSAYGYERPTSPRIAEWGARG